ADVYRDVHAHPELGFAEMRTAGIAESHLSSMGFEVTAGVGGTGVVGLFRNGPGPTVLVRADMDALPVLEATGLPYASMQVSTDPAGNQTPVMHACGHDLHVACLLGACERLAESLDTWSGTLMAVFQPAEELGAGARAMIDDGLYARFGTPAVVLGQHVAPLPAGLIGLHVGAAFAAADSLKVTLHGQGAHGSRPEASVDPVVMAAATVLRAQTIVSWEIPAGETAVVTIGTLHAGTAVNIIPDRAELGFSIRTFSTDVREQVLAAIERIACGEAATARAPRPPDVELAYSFPAVINDEAACARTRPALQSVSPTIVDPGPVTGSEDVGLLASAAGAPCVYWLLGGADPAGFDSATTIDEIAARSKDLPSNHSPMFAPVIEPTLSAGIGALTAAATIWLQY
ncbi:MAG TPA: amidohydrolase, partial [Streptosporangiaceae bacterium]|nr:amidohydrolase [Streptosporangiaceae bacterium]